MGIIGETAVHRTASRSALRGKLAAAALRSRDARVKPLMSVPAHKPEPAEREDQHRDKRNDCNDLVAIEGHFVSLLFAFGRRLGFGRRRPHQELVDGRADGPVAIEATRRTDANKRWLALIYSDDGIARDQKAGTIFDLAGFEVDTALAVSAGAELCGGTSLVLVLAGMQGRLLYGRLRL